MSLEDAQLNAIGFGFEQSGIALFGGQAFRRTLYVQNISTVRQQGAELLALDASNLFMI